MEAKSFIKNLGNNKKRIGLSLVAASVLLAIAYQSISSNAELSISDNASKFVKSSTRDFNDQNVMGKGTLTFEEDKTGINDANAQLNKLEEAAYKARVYSAAENDQSEIVSRSTTSTKIRYTPNNQIEKIDKEEISLAVQVPDLATQTVITPPKMTFIDEVQQQNVVPETYLTKENEVIYDTSAEQQMLEQMMTEQLSKVFQSKASQTITPTLKYQTTTAYSEELANLERVKQEKIAATEQAKALALQQGAIPVSGGTYIPNDLVVKTSNGMVQTNQNEVLFKMGEMVNAITLMGAKSLNLGPIKAQITSGKYAGAILNGTVSAGAEKLQFAFNSMYLPDDPNIIPINAIALQHDTLEIGTATDVDRRSFLRYVVRPLLKAGAAIGDYYANDANAGTTTTSANGTTVQTGAQRSMKNAKKVGLGAAMAEANSDIDSIDTTTIVTQDQYTPIVVYFTNEVVYKKAEQTPSLSRDNAANQYVQPLEADTKIQSAPSSSTNDPKPVGLLP